MKYANSSAFRRALEDRLRAQSVKTGAPLVRLRKMVAFDRLLARLIAVQAGHDDLVADYRPRIAGVHAHGSRDAAQC